MPRIHEEEGRGGGGGEGVIKAGRGGETEEILSCTQSQTLYAMFHFVTAHCVVVAELISCPIRTGAMPSTAKSAGLKRVLAAADSGGGPEGPRRGRKNINVSVFIYAGMPAGTGRRSRTSLPKRKRNGGRKKLLVRILSGKKNCVRKDSNNEICSCC